MGDATMFVCALLSGDPWAFDALLGTLRAFDCSQQGSISTAYFEHFLTHGTLRLPSELAHRIAKEATEPATEPASEPATGVEYRHWLELLTSRRHATDPATAGWVQGWRDGIAATTHQEPLEPAADGALLPSHCC